MAAKTTTAPISWRDVLPTHRAADEFGLMNAVDLRTLAEDIKKNGLKSPATLQLDEDGQPSTPVGLALDLLAGWSSCR
jgi:hypothetical protein